ncbi:aldehyde dehydrogenase family protein [Alicyclobacillus vulcanalis]|uniref:Aldehyde dehydrogenase (NAD+) n=1 Tax=Alicyclobacillus vulcanalis TaxID=252246 RepID=A0A1N7N3Q1_9BACL|nr:aldehyde dehydrogenase family protein [Alicyclobacillus vulcanalis]SIS93033.1 aldehyde dehydrogenase (NAD+) [Alicyclobacillus vulcanalis]
MLDRRQLAHQYIAGEWRDGRSSRVYQNLNPFDGSLVAEIRLASIEDIDEAYRAAAEAQTVWAQVNPFERQAVMEKALRIWEGYRDDIIQLVADEIGGTYIKAAIEFELVKNFLREAATYPLRMEGRLLPATIPGKENRLLRLPAGVVGILSPFNFPMCLSMRALAPAVACGNGVVLKPHEEAALTGGTLLAKVFEEAGVPRGLVNIVVADVQEIGDAFLEHPIPRIISFTGSTAVGRHIAEVAGRHLKRVTLELGGNSALIVLEDADLDLAVDAAVFSRFTHQGQICMCANRVIAVKDVYDAFLEKFVDRVSKLKVGDPRDPQTVIGPLINRRQVDRLIQVVEASIEQGARAAYRGPVDGNVVGPVVLADVREDMACARDEMFGPVVAVMKVEDEDEAVRVANNSDYGLTGAVITRDVERGLRVAMRVETGMFHVNDGTVNDEPLVAFGGEKASGVGRYNGEWGLEEFTTLKWISIQRERRQYPI